MITYFILEKKRTFTSNQQDPYWVERLLFFSLEEAQAEASADSDLFRLYSAPATLVAGTEDFLGR